MIKAIFFDRDGVLINSEFVNAQSALAALKEMGVTPAHEEDETITMGRNPVDYVHDFMQKYSIDHDDFLAAWKVFYEQFFAQAQPFDDSLAFLEEVREKGFLVGLVTNANRERAEQVLQMLDLKNAFDTVVTFDDCTKGKPDPEPYLTAAKNLDVLPSECFVIEDSLAGVTSAKSAGMTCAVRLNDATRHLDYSHADFLLADTRDARQHIKDLSVS